MKKIIIFSLLGILALPVLSAEGIASSSIAAPSNINLNQSIDINITFNASVPPGFTTAVSIENASLSNVTSLQYLSAAGWQNISRTASGNEVIGSFDSSSGFERDGQRVYTIRTAFSASKTYVVGFVMRDNTGNVVSSSAYPIKVAGNVAGINTPTSGLFTRHLGIGSGGQEVFNLQNKLTELGFYKGPITGYFGIQTSAAVRAYQSAHGLSPVGTVGPMTRALLNSQ